MVTRLHQPSVGSAIKKKRSNRQSMNGEPLQYFILNKLNINIVDTIWWWLKGYRNPSCDHSVTHRFVW